MKKIKYEMQIKTALENKWMHFDDSPNRSDLDKSFNIYKMHNENHGWPKVRILKIETTKTVIESVD